MRVLGFTLITIAITPSGSQIETLCSLQHRTHWLDPRYGRTSRRPLTVA